MQLGVWLIGARGGLATTLLVGCKAASRKIAPLRGLTTDLPEFAALPLADPTQFVFGGHEVRSGTLAESAREIAQRNGSLAGELIAPLADDLAAIDAEIAGGSLLNSGDAIRRMVGATGSGRSGAAPRAEIARIAGDIAAFKKRHALARVVVVNLASTEPRLELGESHRTLPALDAALDRGAAESVRPSLLYAYAALSEGCPFVNFTPSNAAVCPAILELARQRGLPIAGSDGKTGETLVKTALAPMFRQRALRVLSWQGYNILGDRDGAVLSNAENLESKVRSKDQALAHILGYPLHSHVGIDYVPSLDDLKTAWDFIHFEGFLGHRMAMQFIWQGCDSILAAPLVIDLIRWVGLAAQRGEGGVASHLASYFKSPLECGEFDYFKQWALLVDYAAGCARSASTAPHDRT